MEKLPNNRRLEHMQLEESPKKNCQHIWFGADSRAHIRGL